MTQPGPAPSPAPSSPTVEELEEQERRLVFRRFGHEDAWALGSLLVGVARERQAPVAIDIHRAGQQLFHAALPGSTPDNDAWIARKRRVVERYGCASYLVGARCRAKGTTFEESSRLDPDTYAAHGGSFPIVLEGTGVIGAVTVSGLPQLQDHLMVVEALTRFLDAGAA
ncbi:heme-degrading domain-containing protein [Streptomyces sp. NEAU-W12]|uniref:heme-degrading domain-containing protein n=1 Tax=Streptomyces sp. NEAU-W12 TaxID=2994668 RepID=UPI00224B29B4|nr:heme-degrading domain-containing protein [Streptomyces sp. NEAU-W12]MCX2925287.1 heme-degrading domain-containing protein [Streptomyces sp. NEAU-W12]